MKARILILSMSIAMFSSISSAGNLIDDNVFGRSFCQNNNGHLKGLDFTKDGVAYYIDSSAGMPNPNVFFQVEFINGTDQFRINEYSEESKELIYQGGVQYQYDLASNELRSGKTILTEKQCEN